MPSMEVCLDLEGYLIIFLAREVHFEQEKSIVEQGLLDSMEVRGRGAPLYQFQGGRSVSQI